MKLFTNQIATVVLAFAHALAVGGCGEEQNSSAPPPPSVTRPAASGPATGGTGIVRGTVSLVGQPPEMKVLENGSCHPGATPIREETVVATPDGRLANVVVFLRDAAAAMPVEPLPPAELDQVNCRFVPHVLALKTGQVLRVRTSDPTLHNVHTLTSINPAKNVAFRPNDGPKEMSFAAAEEFTVRCDVHHWMSARVHVFDHPHFAVSRADGGFELPGVPAGRHTLVFRHELFGDVERTVDVSDGAVAETAAAYEKPR